MKKSEVKEKILRVASRLFYEQGYNLTGINQIIAEADIARASLYNHFESKTDLLLVYLREAEEIWFTAMEDFVSPISDPKEKLLALFDFRMDRQILLNFGGCQFIKISSEVSREEHLVMEAVARQKDRYRMYIGDIAKELPEQPLLTPDLLTETLFLLLEGASVSGQIYKNQESFQKARAIAGKLLCVLPD
jgi:AcrR family transcriptional regulator